MKWGRIAHVLITAEEATCVSVCKPLVHTHMAKDQKTPKVEDRKEPLEISAVGTENARTT